MIKNVAANIFGRSWSFFSNIIFIPLYIHILGFDQYSVIAFSILIAGAVMIFDFGLSATMSREMARADRGDVERYKFLISAERLYALIVLLFVITVISFSKGIAANIDTGSSINDHMMSIIIKVVIAEAGLQLFFRFYLSALMGLERQVEANAYTVAWSVLRNGGAAMMLLVLPNLFIFFIVQVVATAIAVLLLRLRLAHISRDWRVPMTDLLDLNVLRSNWRFSSGVFLIAAVSVVNTQLDKIIISVSLPLTSLGYYTLAVSIGLSMLVVSSPFQAAVQPRLTRYYTLGAIGDARQFYINVSSVVSVLLFPISAVIAWSAGPAIWAWTGDAEAAENAASIVPWVVTSYALLGMSSLAYSVALANGYTRFNNILGLATLLVSIPGYWLAVPLYGAVGAAIVYLCIQATVTTVFHALIDLRFVKLGVIETYMRLYVIPALVACVIAFLWRYVVNNFEGSRIFTILALASGCAVAALGVSLVIVGVFYRQQVRALVEARAGAPKLGGPAS